MKYYVYILQCKDKTFYTGWTNNVRTRLETHNKGKGAKYTRGRLPVKLVGIWEYPSKSFAMRAEYMIKQMNRQDKKMFIAYYINKNLISKMVK